MLFREFVACCAETVCVIESGSIALRLIYNPKTTAEAMVCVYIHCTSIVLVSGQISILSMNAFAVVAEVLTVISS